MELCQDSYVRVKSRYESMLCRTIHAKSNIELSPSEWWKTRACNNARSALVLPIFEELFYPTRKAAASQHCVFARRGSCQQFLSLLRLSLLEIGVLQTHDDWRFSPHGVESHVPLPVNLSLVHMLPVQFPGHLTEKQPSLQVAHILANAASGSHAEWFEGRPVVTLKCHIIVRMRSWQPALRPELTWTAEIALRMRGGEYRGLNATL
jgi:hypothetical protein